MGERALSSAKFILCLLLLFSSFPSGRGATTASKKDDTQHVKLTLHTHATIARTEEDFVCATVDWWPPEKCDFGACAWGRSSIINLDLSNTVLHNALLAFGSLKIRLGGSLQDQVVYSMLPGDNNCLDFYPDKDGRFGFSGGCLSMARWDMIHEFFNTSGCKITFGLNALYGRQRLKGGRFGGDWDPSNARDFITYTLSKQYHIEAWEFGNELCGDGSNPSIVDAKQYGKDLIVLKQMIHDLYNNSADQPRVASPGGFYAGPWFADMLKTSGNGVVDIVTHHIYNLGAGDDERLLDKIKDPSVLDKVADTYHKVLKTIEDSGPWSSPWVGESGGAYNSGGIGISNTFVNSFWYLDQLGMVSRLHHKVFCRQALVGGNYALINHTTFIPNPDYYSALLWHRLMGPGVLDTVHDGPAHLRAYAHCSKRKPGVTLLLINLSESTTFEIWVTGGTKLYEAKSKFRSLSKDKPKEEQREEYHLTPKNGDLQSTVMVLNRQELALINGTIIPAMEPSVVPASVPLRVAPYSIAFVRLKDFKANACPWT